MFATAGCESFEEENCFGELIPSRPQLRGHFVDVHSRSIAYAPKVLNQACEDRHLSKLREIRWQILRGQRERWSTSMWSQVTVCWLRGLKAFSTPGLPKRS